MNVVTRFAPSPTGMLHIGGVRTALFSWLFAKHHQGKFILRVEDTDRERSTAEAVQVILDGMNWLGLNADEGPYFQTDRLNRYNAVASTMLSSGSAYRCYCTREELEAMRNEQLARKEKPRYDGRCRERTTPREGVAPVIRFKNPLSGDVIVDDMIHGQVAFRNEELDDLIVARSDGTPTYNFCVIVDDMDMGITHVIRGDDHLNNTPRQMNMLLALGARPPAYAHLPMILGADGAKLSKRHGAVSVLQYQEEGYLPAALLNYLVRLGWSHGDQEVFTHDEMISAFDLHHVGKAPSAFNPEKLLWLNHQHMMRSAVGSVTVALREQLLRLGVECADQSLLEGVVKIQRERSKTVKEMALNSLYFFGDFQSFDEKAAKKSLTAESLPILTAVSEQVSAVPVWSSESIHDRIVEVAQVHGVPLGKVAQPVRVAVTGGSVSPPIDATLQLLGRDKVLARLSRARSYVSALE
jgi:glutamyl-tRNA synthetase